jgi:predicted nucleic acid-binding protein
VLLIDTNILVYFYLQGIQTLAVRELARRDHDWQSESYLLIELSNVLTSYLVAGILPLEHAQKVFVQAQQKMSGALHTVPHLEVLAICHQYKVTAYDARFLLLAQNLGCKLVTEDKKLRAAAPDLTQSIDEALAPT